MHFSFFKDLHVVWQNKCRKRVAWSFCRQLALSDPQDVVNDAEGQHKQLHVLLNLPQRGQEPESVILHPEDVTSNGQTVALHHRVQTQGLIFSLEIAGQHLFKSIRSNWHLIGAEGMTSAKDNHHNQNTQAQCQESTLKSIKITHSKPFKTSSRTVWSLPDSDNWIPLDQKDLDRTEPSGWFSLAVLAAMCVWDRRTFERSKCWILKSTTSGQIDSLRIVAIHHIRTKWMVNLLRSIAGPTGTGRVLAILAHRMVTRIGRYWKC